MNPHLIETLKTPSMVAVAEIARHVGAGMGVERFESIPAPSGTVQVWEFIDRTPPRDRPPVVVCVYLAGGRIQGWTPAAEAFEPALVRFRGRVEGLWAKRRTKVDPPPAPATGLALPPAPPGVRVTLVPGPNGKPFGFDPARAAAP